ncbi:tetratricopeptide repeat protein [Alkalicoccus luteus]|uniref:Tetratricopeptide repeat protein n=1 Tax=Alkalicoccus luteus TaxID=1237094 RepID=A0A969PMF3_9BACI|nr:tetratricopeptide repeat protein [Alkalicoccus luteus]NJP36890.1 tetratricopeptide repeat protein [Alkalicoccus luteus]
MEKRWEMEARDLIEHTVHNPDNWMREEVRDPDKAAALLSEAENHVPKDGVTALLCASLLRISGRAEEALPLFHELLGEARRQACPRKESAALIRLGEAMKYSGTHVGAVTCFKQALSLKRLAPEYEDFAWQHLGKVQWEMGETKSAENSLEEALRLRRLKKDEALIKSTLAALCALRNDMWSQEA